MEAVIIPFAKPKLKCSFCGHSEPKVKILITNSAEGTNFRGLCTECAKEALKRMQEEN